MQPSLNTTFREVAAEPWMANRQRWRLLTICISEHLVILNATRRITDGVMAFENKTAFFVKMNHPHIKQGKK